MHEITFACPHCHQILEAPAEYAGQTVACPGCQAEIAVPEESDPKALNGAINEDGGVTLDAEMDEGEVTDPKAGDGTCAECGAEMEPDSVLCLACGYHAGLGRKIHTDFDNK